MKHFRHLIKPYLIWAFIIIVIPGDFKINRAFGQLRFFVFFVLF